MLLLQNPKQKVFYILSYLLLLDIAVRPIGISGRVLSYMFSVAICFECMFCKELS
jgi:hypothetical protein